MESDIDLGERLTRWRESRGMTQAELASRIEISPAAIAQWELSQTKPTSDNLQKAVDALDLTMSQFWGRVPPKKKRAS